MLSSLTARAPQFPTLKLPAEAAAPKNTELREVFDQFVGETFYGQMLSAMRKGVGKPAYFHGGQAEEIFQSQMDQVLVEQMTQATSGSFTGPMFEMFTLARK